MQYAGDAVEALSVDERATMTNMAAEIGGFPGIVSPDKKALEFLMERRGMKRADVEKMKEGLQSNPNAQDCRDNPSLNSMRMRLRPMIATPGNPGNGKYVRELDRRVPIGGIETS